MKDNTKFLSATEKILLALTLLMCGFVSLYNAFFIPEVPSDIKLSGNISNQKMLKEDTHLEIAQGQVKLNTANKETLVEFLPGIGPKIADRIISYRETHGGFSHKEELMNIKGISAKMFEKIEKYVTL